MNEVDVVRIDRNNKENVKDRVADEVPLTIHLDGKELLTLLCSPDSLKELCVGFLYTSGLIKSVDGIRDILIDSTNWIVHVELKTKTGVSVFMFRRLYTSGCGKRKITSKLKVASDKITELMDSFQKSSVSFRKTGGVHSAALSDGNNILVFKEDIGRHNALDKAIGEALIKGLNMGDLIVLTSGRISSEIVLKVEKISSAFLISRSAPTIQAIMLAKELNLTLVGFVRGKRMNIYSGYERVI